jgi:hypothetical protein
MSEFQVFMFKHNRRGEDMEGYGRHDLCEGTTPASTLKDCGKP